MIQLLKDQIKYLIYSFFYNSKTNFIFMLICKTYINKVTKGLIYTTFNHVQISIIKSLNT